MVKKWTFFKAPSAYLHTHCIYLSILFLYCICLYFSKGTFLWLLMWSLILFVFFHQHVEVRRHLCKAFYWNSRKWKQADGKGSFWFASLRWLKPIPIAPVYLLMKTGLMLRIFITAHVLVNFWYHGRCLSKPFMATPVILPEYYYSIISTSEEHELTPF